MMNRNKNLVITIMLFLSISYSSLYSQLSDINQIQSMLPKMLGASNEGYDFWLTVPPSTVGGSSNEYIRFFITSVYETTVKLNIPVKGYSEQKTCLPNRVIEFKLLPNAAQPFAHQEGKPRVEEVYPGNGINITSEKPIIVYCVVNFNRSADSYLALPVNTLGKNYVVTSFNDLGNSQYPSEVCIVAAHDNTNVTFTMGGTVSSLTAGGLAPGQSVSKMLNEGDVFVFQSKGKGSDLTGSTITSTKPVSVFSGSVCANVPINITRCDYLVEMNMPTYTWGRLYPISKIAKRGKPSVVRIFAKEPSTVVKRDGIPIGTIPTSGGIISQGYLELRMMPMDENPKSTVFSSDKPFTVIQYNTGNNDDGESVQTDPFMMNQLPFEQYYDECTFITAGVTGQQFPEYYINLIYPLNNVGSMPEDIEIANFFNSSGEYEKLFNKFSYTEDWLTDSIDGKKYAARQMKVDAEGLYKIRSNYKIAAYTYGSSANESYGMPAKAYLKNLEKINDIIPPVPSWVQNPNLSYLIGKVIDMPADQSSRSNMGLVVYHKDLSNNYNFSCDEFQAGEDRSVNWELKAIDASKDAKAVITFIDRNANDTTVIIEYFSGQISCNPVKSLFGDLRKGTTSEKSVWVVNRSESMDRIVTKVQFKKGNQGFSLGNNTLPFTIPKKDSVEIKIRFIAPDEAGLYEDSLGFGDNTVFSYQGYVSANVGEPLLAVGDIDFGQKTVGTVAKELYSITNSGTLKLIITGVKNKAGSVFSSNSAISRENPLVLSPGETNEDNYISFLPANRLNYDDTLIIESNTGFPADSMLVVKGSGVRPVISAGEVNFTNIYLGGSYTADFNISNDGEDNLVITGYEPPANSDMKVIIKESLSEIDPIVVNPGEKISAQVKYEPARESKSEIFDRISFISNSVAEGDNKVNITVNSVINNIFEDNHAARVTIYPNPASDAVFVEGRDGLPVSCEIFEQSGRKIIENFIPAEFAGAYKIKIDCLVCGVYFIKLRYDNKVVVERFSVVK